MRAGNNFIFLLLGVFFNSSICFAEEKIISSPLINLNEIKPSFEDIEEIKKDYGANEIIKNKKSLSKKNISPSAEFIGLDKITAKTYEISISLGETKKFGLLEIKVLKCGKVNSKAVNDNADNLQVKDLSISQDEKVFIFNGWTFSSDPSLAPFDHAIYDLQLVNCSNV